MKLVGVALLIAASEARRRPHLVTILADDLGWYDTAPTNPFAPTPTLAALAAEGLVLNRHYVFRYCSPTRRAFLTGRFPTSITSAQPDGADLCSDFLPLAATTLAEKLAGAGYACHFVGKGHLGYETTDHLPVRRGFASHVGFLAGSEAYAHGGGAADPASGAHDLWEDDAPAFAAVADVRYATSFYASRTEKIVAAHDAAAPLFLYLAVQNTHKPYTSPPPSERGAWPRFPLCADCVYAQMLHALDRFVLNATAALRRRGLWDDALVLFSSDNGAIGAYGNNHPLRGHKHEPWEGATRATAFLAGGVLPARLRGAATGAKLVHVADWYPTFLGLAGVDATDDAVFGGARRPIDGVDVWPLLTGANATQPRPLTPITEVSLVDAARPAGPWWKVVVLAGRSVSYAEDASTAPAPGPCLAGRQPDPPQPGARPASVFFLFSPAPDARARARAGRTDPIVSDACVVCNATAPCLYDVLGDPGETRNVAAAHPAVVARLARHLAAAQLYYVTGHLEKAVLDRDYVPVDPGAWRGFAGPCYARRSRVEHY